MARQQKASPTAYAYAQSLLELANESKSAESIGQELAGLRQILSTQPMFRMYLADPSISAVERRDALDRIFRGKVSQLLLNFLGVVNDHTRLGLLDQIIDAYDELLDEQLGKVEVDVYVAQKLAPEQLEQVRQRVSAAMKKDAVMHQYVDDSLIGGLVLRVGDKLIDASAKYQLQALKNKLMNAPITETI
jgi:F-type H+-transporting ATPase subunit delta